ncbi:MAG: Do family serine endopeptidase [Burkholderiales bacterium]|nr:Do family serine endopeptidase [Burkholderiales bacterium]
MNKKLFVLILSTSLGMIGCNQAFADTDNTQSAITTEAQLPNFTKLVKQVGNTVVNITSDLKVSTNQNNFPFPIPADPNDPFYQLFKHAFPNQNPQNNQQVRRAFGSGFIISSDGYILTNAHVINGAKKIIVRTTDKQELEAKLIGLDTKTDVALLKVNGKNLHSVIIGDSNKLEAGQWVAAIGAPFGFDNTVTQGIVSAINRNLPTDNYIPFIQTDVPINPGNSGGPLFNLKGEVVGINSQIYSKNGGYMGLSFSIPIDIAINIADQLKAHGSVEHGLLGIQVQDVTQQIAQSFGLSSQNGALVAYVAKDSAAAMAGIKPGDVILSANGTELNDANKLPIIVGNMKPGDRIDLLINRNGKQLNIVATLGGGASKVSNASAPTKTNALKINNYGIEVRNLSSEQLNQLGIKGGVIISNVTGIAQLSGLLPDDIIVSVNNIQVNNVQQLKTLIGNKPTIALLIIRGDAQMFITLTTR